MPDKSVKMEKDGENREEKLQEISENVESAKEHELSKSLIQRLQPAEVLYLNIKELQTRSKLSASCRWRLLFQFYGLDDRIPKQLIGLDEKYIRCCLEMMHVSALRAASGNLSSKMGILSNGLGSEEIRCGNIYDGTRSRYALSSGSESVIISSMEDQILGSITGSKSMKNILGSPLLKQFSGSDSNKDTGLASSVDTTEDGFYDFEGFLGGSTVSSKVSRPIAARDLGFGRKPVHERIVSGSSTTSTLSDQSSYVSSNSICNGVLHCTWKNGSPLYTFSTDDQKEVYAANLYKVASPDEKGLDYVYVLHSRPGQKSKYDIRENESRIVGKMRVSTLIKLCPKNSEIRETQFVLFGSTDNCPGETQTSKVTIRKNKALRRKLSDKFSCAHPDRQRTSSIFSGTSTIFEDTSCWDPTGELYNNFDPGGLELTERDYPPNLELAAIIVKDHLSGNSKKAEIGGWGLKFLKNSETSAASAPLESEFCARKGGGKGLKSMDVLIPAGIHGGPRTRNGGPSSLANRWSSGGHCDCGGWDTGCPLTVLNMRPNSSEISPQQVDIHVECKTFDLVVQGSKQGTPTMKMTNIHEGLYYIHFEQVLSALQAFSVAIAMIHSHSPRL